jgi:type VI secretion system protein ImpI
LGTWTISDHSTNGTFLNGDADPLGRGRVRDLKDGDRLHLGTYEIEVRLLDASARIGEGAQLKVVTASGLPDDFDPMAPVAGAEARLDTNPNGDQAAGTLVPGATALPEDWDAPDPPDPPKPAPGGKGSASPLLLPEDWDAPDWDAPAAARKGHAEDGLAAVVPAKHGARSSHAAAAGGELLAAFLRGAKAGDLTPPHPVAAMEGLGATLREVVRGLRQLIMARAAVKAQFSVEQTAIRTRGNNPLKFSLSDDDALAAFLGRGRRSDMGAVDAVSEVLNDIRLHEIATAAAFQTAARGLLAELDPEKLRGSIGEGGFNILSVQRKARAWDAFEVEYARLRDALANGPDSEFGRAFAEAYEHALSEASKEPSR